MHCSAREEGGIIRVCIVGLGYVGVPLAVEFVRGGLHVIGIDIDEAKVSQLSAGRSYIPDVPDSTIAEIVGSGRLQASTSFVLAAEADAICICVPTPLNKSQDPDISAIVHAVEQIAPHLRQGMLIVLESTTYPGTTEELVLPKLAESGRRVGVDFYLAFSPERVDPGNPSFGIRNTPKIIGGVTPACTKKALELYRHAVDHLVPVSNARSAEMVKLLENTFRAVNIAMVNELAIICERLNVDAWEVIDAAKTKPFGFMPFYPGPGLGGHCIPIDPLYLSWKMKTLDYTARFIDLANTINSNMPQYVVERISDALNAVEKSVKGSRILVLGVAYKKNIGDIRESPAIDIIGLLRQKGADVAYSDPFVPELSVLDENLASYPLQSGLTGFDLVAIIADHDCFDYNYLLASCPLIFDTRNATARHKIPAGCTVVRL
ncbi:MAG: nucleotide sugar dehydrogenase [Candidatus Hydrogenedentes bacterium]|nr:nucleotide sugar dehydrogenase [Candidatus Hydrogenedentota bacterium]